MVVATRRTHELNDKRATARPIILYLALFFLVWSLRATVGFTLDQKLTMPVAKAVYSNIVKLAVWVGPALYYLKKFAGCEPLAYLKLTTRGRRRDYLAALALSLIFFVGMICLARFGVGQHLSALAQMRTLLVPVLSNVVSSALEEILFRGFILQQLWARIGFWSANLTTALLFVLVHWPNWLWTGGFHAGLLVTSLSVFILALFLGYLLRLTNSLWPSIAAHVVNNLISILLHA
jgi:uncharacterized protein